MRSRPGTSSGGDFADAQAGTHADTAPLKKALPPTHRCNCQSIGGFRCRGPARSLQAWSTAPDFSSDVFPKGRKLRKHMEKTCEYGPCGRSLSHTAVMVFVLRPHAKRWLLEGPWAPG